jgi:hypothetical protein
MATPDENIEKARELVAAGDLKPAARLLSDAVYATTHPPLLVQIQELARQGLAQAGRFSKGQWSHLVEESGDRLARSEGAPA